MTTLDVLAHERTETAPRDFAIIAAFVIALSGATSVFALLCGHDGARDEAAKLTDLMVIAITLSGITIPIMIAYMSLGRTKDVFSEIGNAVQFFLKRASVKDEDLPNALLLDDSEESRTHNLDVSALDQMNQLRSASGEFLDPEYKIHLVPQEFKDDYLYYLHDENDQRLSRRHAWLAGIPALACSILIFLDHFLGESSGLKFLGHMASIMAVAANLCSYWLLLRIASLRSHVRKGVTTRLRHIADSVARFVPGSMMAQSANLNNARRGARQSASRLEAENPDKQPDP